MSRGCSSRNDYFLEFSRFNGERLENCLIKTCQRHQAKPVVIETVDPNKARPYFMVLITLLLTKLYFNVSIEELINF